jgi:acyl carrier protein phosphodiesterase
MNYLAHAYLSFNQDELLVGNMISDYVKGKLKFNYALGIQQGIMLHRAIDEFTDAHPYVKEAKQIFVPNYRLYAGAFIDVSFDHYLAISENEFATNELFSFSQKVYDTLEQYSNVLPEKFGNLLPNMIKHNWLYNYQHAWGIKSSFGGLMRRAQYIEEIDTAFELFMHHYKTLQQLYDAFFPQLKQFAIDTWQQHN